MHFTIADIDNKTDIYKLMSQTIIPRPIAWIVTEDDGVVNIAPFSYFTGLSSSPATVLVSIGQKSDGTPKDTLANLRRYKRCTLCMVESEDLEKMHCSSKALGHDESEAEVFDIATKYEKEDFPPKIVSSPVVYFCELMQEVTLGGETVPVILEIKEIFVDDRIVTDREKLDIAFDPVARIGKNYAFLDEAVTPPPIP